MKKLLFIFIVFILIFFGISCLETEVPSEFKMFTEESRKLRSPVVTIKYLDNGVIRLQWNKVDGAKVYNIYKNYNESSEDVYVNLAENVSDLYYDDVVSTSNIMEENKIYKYIVVSKTNDDPSFVESNKDIESSTNISVKIPVAAKIPTMGEKILNPGNIKITEVNNFLYVTWDAVDYVNSYNIYINQASKVYIDKFNSYDDNSEFTEISNSLIYKIPKSGAGIYTFTVKPVAISNWFVDGAFSTISYTEEAILDSPKNVEIRSEYFDYDYSDLENNIEIIWDKVVKDMSGNKLTVVPTYQIWRREENKPNNFILLSIDSNIYYSNTNKMVAKDATVVKGISYEYFVVALNESNMSNPSNKVIGRMFDNINIVYNIKAPEIVKFVMENEIIPYEDYIKIEWNISNYTDTIENTNLSTIYVKPNNYDIYRSDDNGNSYKLLVSDENGIQSLEDADRLYYKDDTVIKGKKYYYKVRSKNSKYNLISDLSGRSDVCRIKDFNSVTNFVVTKNNLNHLIFEWKNVEYTEYYQIRQCNTLEFDEKKENDSWNEYGTEFDNYIDKNTNSYINKVKFDDTNDFIQEKIYYFWIVAIAENGEKASSEKISVKR